MSTPAVPDSVLDASLGQVLMRAARLYNERAVARVQRQREPRLRLAHTQLFPHLSAAGVRPTALARRLGISKQAVSPLVDDLLAWGLVERVDDPGDRRAWLIRLTPAGVAAILDGLTVLRGIEAELEAELGVEATRTLHQGLVAAMRVLESPESGAFSPEPESAAAATTPPRPR